MEVFYFITSFILVNRLYKSVKYTSIWMKWKSVLTFGQIAIWVAYLVCKACFHNDGINSILGASVLLGDAAVAVGHGAAVGGIVRPVAVRTDLLTTLNRR